MTVHTLQASKKVKGILLTADDTLYEKTNKETSTIHLKGYKV